MHCLAYRLDPAKNKDRHDAVGHGAIVSDEFDTAEERDAAVAELRANPRVQWAKAYDTADE